MAVGVRRFSVASFSGGQNAFRRGIVARYLRQDFAAFSAGRRIGRAVILAFFSDFRLLGAGVVRFGRAGVGKAASAGREKRNGHRLFAGYFRFHDAC